MKKTFSRVKLSNISVLHPSDIEQRGLGLKLTLLSFAELKEKPAQNITFEEEKVPQKTTNNINGVKKTDNNEECKYNLPVENKKIKKPKGTQFILSLGQKKYTKCHECGVLYSTALASEARMHRKLHRKYVSEQKKLTNYKNR